MRIWMEDHYGEKGHFAVKITLYLLLLLAVAMVLPVGVTLLALRRGWPVTEIALAVCLADVILTVYGAGEIGNKVHRYCTVFCRDNSGRLFAVDITKFAGCSRGLAGYIRMLCNTQRTMRNMKEGFVLERYMSEEKSLEGLEGFYEKNGCKRSLQSYLIEKDCGRDR